MTSGRSQLSSSCVLRPFHSARRLEISGILLGNQAQSNQTDLSNMDPAAGQPQLQIQVRVFRDGQMLNKSGDKRKSTRWRGVIP